MGSGEYDVVGVAVASTDSESPLSKGDTMVMPLLDAMDGNSATPMLVNDWTVPKIAREKSRVTINGESVMFMVLSSPLSARGYRRCDDGMVLCTG